MRLAMIGILILVGLCVGCSLFPTPTPIIIIVTATPNFVLVQPVVTVPAVVPGARSTLTPVSGASATSSVQSSSSSTPVPLTLSPSASSTKLVATPTSLTCSGNAADTGKIGLYVVSFIGGNDSIQLTIGGKTYPIAPNSTICLDLPPGMYSWNASVRGLSSGSGAREINAARAKETMNLCAPEGTLTDRCPSSSTNSGPVVSPPPPLPPTPVS